MTSGPQHKAPVDLAVEAELSRLPTTPIADLRKRYRDLFQTEPPKAFGPDLLRRSIAHRIQEKAYGGIPANTRRLLDQLVKADAANTRRVKREDVIACRKRDVVSALQDADRRGKSCSSPSSLAARVPSRQPFAWHHKDLMPMASGDEVHRCAQDDGRQRQRERPRPVTGQISTSVSPFTT
jgi:hypothetical protein